MFLGSVFGCGTSGRNKSRIVKYITFEFQNPVNNKNQCSHTEK